MQNIGRTGGLSPGSITGSGSANMSQLDDHPSSFGMDSFNETPEAGN
jgi:hypothetical protein